MRFIALLITLSVAASACKTTQNATSETDSVQLGELGSFFYPKLVTVEGSSEKFVSLCQNPPKYACDSDSVIPYKMLKDEVFRASSELFREVRDEFRPSEEEAKRYQKLLEKQNEELTAELKTNTDVVMVQRIQNEIKRNDQLIAAYNKKIQIDEYTRAAHIIMSAIETDKYHLKVNDRDVGEHWVSGVIVEQFRLYGTQIRFIEAMKLEKNKEAIKTLRSANSKIGLIFLEEITFRDFNIMPKKPYFWAKLKSKTIREPISLKVIERHVSKFKSGDVAFNKVDIDKIIPVIEPLQPYSAVVTGYVYDDTGAVLGDTKLTEQKERWLESPRSTGSYTGATSLKWVAVSGIDKHWWVFEYFK